MDALDYIRRATGRKIWPFDKFEPVKPIEIPAHLKTLLMEVHQHHGREEFDRVLGEVVKRVREGCTHIQLKWDYRMMRLEVVYRKPKDQEAFGR